MLLSSFFPFSFLSFSFFFFSIQNGASRTQLLVFSIFDVFPWMNNKET